MGYIKNDVDVAEFFLKEAHVAIVPGEAFSYPDFVRFVFAKSEKTITEGFNRIATAIELLK